LSIFFFLAYASFFGFNIYSFPAINALLVEGKTIGQCAVHADKVYLCQCIFINNFYNMIPQLREKETIARKMMT